MPMEIHRPDRVPCVNHPGEHDLDVHNVHNVHNVHSIPSRIEVQVLIRIPLGGRPHRLKSLLTSTFSKKIPCRACMLALFASGPAGSPILYCGREPACGFSELPPDRGLFATHCSIVECRRIRNSRGYP